MHVRSLFLVAPLALTATAAPPTSCPGQNHYPYPTTKLAGIDVIDTQIVRDARALVKGYGEPYLQKHVLRTWLFGAAMIQNNATLRESIDVEVHALATILHDLGWDLTPNSRWVSPDQRFEVDGALGAQKFIREHPDGKRFTAAQLMDVYDSISLHASPGLGVGKNPLVRLILASIMGDNPYALLPLPKEQLDAIFQTLPNDDIAYGTNKTWSHLAATKPETTYGTIIEPFGVAFVPGYSPVGHRPFDIIVGELHKNGTK
ncbi:hypothetical protein F5Y17DRAFT_113229 [Xylariaceae sp. FL0594]|nr:hypothetical protein F5Y17DRAFT_113229 [Xylariaceae sp. FL0594]